MQPDIAETLVEDFERGLLSRRQLACRLIADYRGGVTCLARTQFFRRTGRFSMAFSGLRHLWRESP